MNAEAQRLQMEAISEEVEYEIGVMGISWIEGSRCRMRYRGDQNRIAGMNRMDAKGSETSSFDLGESWGRMKLKGRPKRVVNGGAELYTKINS
jgi:hypothetical protein